MSDPSPPTPRISIPPPASRKRLPVRILEWLGSLRVTVTLFVLALILVFFGTLAQIDSGIWTVVRDYFRSFLVWIPVQLILQFGQKFFGVPSSWHVGGAIPFPGGFSLGVAFLVNLTAAYGLRLPTYSKKWKQYALMAGVIGIDLLLGYVAVMTLSQWGFLVALTGITLVTVAALYPFRRFLFFTGNRIGIFALHVGLVLMIAGEFITGLFAIEGNMRIEEGQTTSAVMHTHSHELAISQTNESKDTFTVIPAAVLRKGGKVSDDSLPFDVRLVRWMRNSDLVRARPGANNPATTGFGLEWLATESKEVPGAATQQGIDLPSAYVELIDRTTGESMGTYLFTMLNPAGHTGLDPVWQDITIGGKTYRVALRFRMTYKPYSLKLLEFKFDRHRGTDMAKDFSSRVILSDPERGDREVIIRMNEPLRHRGDTYFQADWNKVTEKGTILQVVRNPGWQLPYWSCAVVTMGMLIHFGLNLVNYLGRRGDS